MADPNDDLDGALARFDENILNLNAMLTACEREQAAGKTGLAHYDQAVELRRILVAEAADLQRRIEARLKDLS